MKNIKRQPRLTVRESLFRNDLARRIWKENKNRLTMQEIAHIFRMPFPQFHKIVYLKSKKK